MARGKRYKQAMEVLADVQFPVDLGTASTLIKQTASAKFDESIDVDVRLGVDPKHADQMVRGVVALPHGTGKDVRVCVICNESLQAEATEAGAEHVGLDDLIEKINGGWADIDVIIASPDAMGKLGKLGRVLGPRGLMPNPKSGTVTKDIGKAVKEVKAGKIDFRVDKAGILHCAVGRASFSSEQIKENVEAFMREVLRLRPGSAKGAYIRSLSLGSTMGPSLELDHANLVADLR